MKGLQVLLKPIRTQAFTFRITTTRFGGFIAFTFIIALSISDIVRQRCRRGIARRVRRRRRRRHIHVGVDIFLEERVENVGVEQLRSGDN